MQGPSALHARRNVSPHLLDVNLPETFVSCKQTSIYDHTLHASFSTLVHKLIGTVTLGAVEELCSSFCANAQASKAFLFDVNSRLYMATDASPVDAGTLALCLDYIKTLHKLAPLYTFVRLDHSFEIVRLTLYLAH